MFDVFAEVIAPILVVAGLGGWLGHRFGVSVGALSQLTFHLFSPALVFDAISSVELPASVAGRIVAAALAVFGASVLVSWLVGRLLGFEREDRAALVLVGSLSNGGNMGLPVALLAFGQPGLDVAVVAFVTGAFVTYTLGVVIASSATSSMRAAWSAPLRVPAVWAAVAGGVVNVADLDVPTTIEASTATLAGAAIPTMLVVLGLHVVGDLGISGGRKVTAALVVRLVLGPLVAFGATEALGLDGVAQRTLIVLGGMPTAVITTILATQYRARPTFVTRVVVASTLVSIATLTVLVAALR